MKKTVFLLAGMLIISVSAWAQDAISLTWQANTAEKTITVHATSGTDNVIVAWGDGIVDTLDGKGDDDVLLAHTYSSEGSYDVLIATPNNQTVFTLLECVAQQLNALDVSSCADLIEISCSGNLLTQLDVSSNTALESLLCLNNQLSSLNVSSNTSLKTLRCNSNRLRELDLSANTALTDLYCNDNQLSLSQLYAIWNNKNINEQKKLIPQEAYDTAAMTAIIDLSAEQAFGNPAAQTNFTITMEDNSPATDKYTFVDGELIFTETGDYKVVMKNDSVREGIADPGTIATTTTHYHVVKLSDNTLLANLTVSAGTLTPDFDPETMRYTLNDPFCEGTSITLSGNADDESATVEGLGEKILENGTTELTVTVTAEDGVSEREYIIDVTVNPTYQIFLQEIIGESETYDFYGRNLTASGEYDHNLQTVNGCDSTYYLTLIVNPEYKIDEADTICQGESLTWQGKEYKKAGVYYANYKAISGRDSVHILTLTVNPSYLFEETHTMCSGETYTWQGLNYDTEGIYYAEYPTVDGCDSIYQLTLTVNQSYLFQETHTMCQGETYTWHGTEYDAAGVYTDSRTAINGCDSIYELTLIVNPSYLITETHAICQGETYQWHGKEYNTDGVYWAEYSTADGCDSIYKLTLTVTPTYSFSETHTMCQGETYTWHGTSYSNAGIYQAEYQTANGCDSIYELTLTVNQSYLIAETHTMCQGATYLWHGTEYNESGVYLASYTTINGCDSIYELSLTVNPSYNTISTVFITEGEKYDFYGTDLTMTGKYRHTLQTVHGCDSLITIALFVNLKVSINETDMHSFKVYPNPTSGQLKIENGELKINKVEVFNIFGTKLSTINTQHSTLNTQEVDLSSFAKGVYIIVINDEKMIKVVKE